MTRVAITGLGAITALGRDVRALDEALRAGRPAIAEVTLFDPTGCRTRLAAQAPSPTGEAAAVVNASRPDRFGLQAALEAVADASLDETALARGACVFGTGTGGAPITESYLAAFTTGGEAAVADRAGDLVPHQPSSVTDLVCRRFALRGPRTTIMTACSSSATAIGYAADLLRLGKAEVAIAGGAEGLCRLTYAGFNALRATSTEPCRPFDAARKGLTLGEGGAALVLETEEHARRRGARVYGWLAGWGITADAHHMTAPHPEGDGAARAMLAALADARLAPSDIGYVNAHGTGTPHNDAAETAALKRVFGANTRTPISSTKSMHGHTLGAAGAVEAVVSLLALRGDYLPPTTSLDTPDPAFGSPLDYIPREARAQRVDAILSSSFAFGGNNTVLVFTR